MEWIVHVHFVQLRLALCHERQIPFDYFLHYSKCTNSKHNNIVKWNKNGVERTQNTNANANQTHIPVGEDWSFVCSAQHSQRFYLAYYVRLSPNSMKFSLFLFLYFDCGVHLTGFRLKSSSNSINNAEYWFYMYLHKYQVRMSCWVVRSCSNGSHSLRALIVFEAFARTRACWSSKIQVPQKIVDTKHKGERNQLYM